MKRKKPANEPTYSASRYKHGPPILSEGPNKLKIYLKNHPPRLDDEKYLGFRSS